MGRDRVGSVILRGLVAVLAVMVAVGKALHRPSAAGRGFRLPLVRNAPAARGGGSGGARQRAPRAYPRDRRRGARGAPERLAGGDDPRGYHLPVVVVAGRPTNVQQPRRLGGAAAGGRTPRARRGRALPLPGSGLARGLADANNGREGRCPDQPAARLSRPRDVRPLRGAVAVRGTRPRGGFRAGA